MAYIKHWLITGDKHGDFSGLIQFNYRFLETFDPNETAIVILGDVGINFYFNDRDRIRKEILQDLGYTFYLVRGNHDANPFKSKTPVYEVYDPNVKQVVLREQNFPNINYFYDGITYQVNNKPTLVLGGAYSVDKNYRLANHLTWFEDEQPCEKFKKNVLDLQKGRQFGYIFTHTCPMEDRPVSNFMSNVVQKDVDTSTEQFLSEVKSSVKWGEWYCGHYHDNKQLIPNKMFLLFEDIKELK